MNIVDLPMKIVIFHSYVSLPDGKWGKKKNPSLKQKYVRQQLEPRVNKWLMTLW